MTVRRIDRDDCAAWLIRCNPVHEPELPALIARGGHRIVRWCVANNYRTRLMTVDDRVLFWVSGDGRRLARGIWGIGVVLGVLGLNGPADSARRAAGMPTRDRPEAKVDIPLFQAPISDRDLRATGIADLEVQIQPFGSNPSWVSQRSMARLIDAFPQMTPTLGR